MMDLNDPSAEPLTQAQILENKIVDCRAIAVNFTKQMLRNLPNCHELAEDLAQMTMIRALHSAPNFRGDCKITSWVCTIAQNVVRDFLRQQKRRQAINCEMPTSFGGMASGNQGSVVEEPSENLQEGQLLAKLDLGILTPVLDLLPDRDRAIFYLKNLDEWTFQEIADRFGIPLSTVKTCLYSTTEKLRRHASRPKETPMYTTPSIPPSPLSIGTRRATSYMDPAWVCPTDGIVIALGYESVGVLRSTYGNRVHFWEPSQIQRATDIPGNVVAVFLHRSIQDATFVDMKNRITAAGKPYYRCPNNNELGTELGRILKGADLSVDPNLLPALKDEDPLHGSAAPPNPTGSDPAPPPDRVLWTAEHPPGKGEVKAFFERHLNPLATRSSEAERLMRLIKVEHGYDMTLTAAQQQVHHAHGSRSHQPATGASSNLGDAATLSKLNASSVQAAGNRLKLGISTYFTAINKEIDGMAELAAELDSENQRLIAELAGSRAEANRLRDANAALQRRIEAFAEVEAAFDRLRVKK